MAEGQFNPDLLLTVGADISALRQQLAQIGRELSLPPIQVRIEASGQQIQQEIQQTAKSVRETAQNFSDVRRQAEGAVTAVRSLRQAQQDFARDTQAAYDFERRLLVLQQQGAAENEARIRKLGLLQLAAEKEVQDLIQARGRLQSQAAAEDEARTRVAALRNIAAEREYQAVLQQRGKDVVAATAENQARTQALGRMIIAAEKEYQAVLQQSGRIRAQADADDEVRTRRIGVMQINAEKEYRAELTKTAEIREAQLNRLQALQNRLNLLLIRNPGAATPETAQLQDRITGLQQAVLGGGKIETAAVREATRDVAGFSGALAVAKAEAVASEGIFERFFTRFGRYTQFIIGATLAGAGFAAVFATFRQIADTDRILKQIEATVDDTTNKFELLRASYELILEGNRRLGLSFKESGQVVFELQKALDGNVEAIRGAYLPALALTSLGEGNHKEIVRTLIGVYELFGDTLGRTATDVEKFRRISDILIAASVSSIADIDGFRAALATVAPAARSANIGLDETVALLAVLQNGLQSSQRAGTGLSRLIRDIQEGAPRIGKVFDIPVDINRPIKVLEILLEVSKKIREAGPLTDEMSNRIKRAFGDERAERALLTLVELLPQLNTMMDTTANSAGRTERVIRTLGEQLYASLGRLGGALFEEINRGLASLQGIQPGEASGVVGFIDAITQAIKNLSRAVRDLNSLPEDFIEAIKNPAATAARRAASAASEAGPREQERIRAAAARIGITYGSEEPLGPPSPIYGPPSPIYGPPSPQMKDRAAELEAAVRRIQQEGQNAVDRSNPYLSFEVRLSLAQGEVDRVQKEFNEAAKDYKSAVFGKTGNEEEAGKSLLSASEKLGRARLAVIQLERGEAEAGARSAAQITSDMAQATKQAQELLGEISRIEEQTAKASLANALARSFADADLSAEKFNQTVNKIRESLAIDTNADTDKLRALQGRLFDSPNLSSEQISREYDRLNKLIEEKNTEATAKIADGLRKASLGAGAAALRDLLNTFATGNTVGLSTEDLQKIADKAGGVTDLTEALRTQTAVLGLWGPAAAQATLAAKFGFASVEEVVLEFGRTGNPVLAALIETIQRLGKVTGESGLAAINTQIDVQSRALQSARGAYGQVGEAAERWALALSLEKTTYDRLEPAQRDAIDRLAKITTELKNAAAASALFRLGFSAEDADALAKRASEVSQAQQQAETGIGVLRTLNEEQRRARDLQDQFIQESAKSSGSFFTFFVSSLRQAANEAGDFWDNLKSLAEDTAKNMQTSFSDFFFDTFTGKLQTAEQLWSNFLTSMLRALSDFMSKQLVRSFLNILTGTAGGEGGAGSGGAGLIGNGGASALGGVIGGFGNILQNAQAGGAGGALFGLPPVPPSTVTVGQSNPDLEFAGLAPTSLQTAGRPATSGLIGTGGNVSKELSSAGAILAAYTAAQSVIKLTSDISTERDRNSGTGGLVGAGVGGAIGAYFGSTALGAGAGGLIGSYLGGLFGSNAPAAGRFDEINRTISTVQTSLEAMIAGANTFTSLFSTLQGFQGGGALAGSTGQPVQLSVGGQPISGLTQSEFLSAVRANPSSLQASVQAGVNPALLGPLNQEVVSAILTRIAALDQIGQQINETIADILAETVVPVPTGATSLETLKQQAVDFRAVVDQLIATNVAQTQALEQQLAATTDPALVLQYTTTIKGLIEKRYQDETQLVQKFAGQLDSLANSLKSVSSSIEKQIFDLQLSNFGPTNPLAGLQLAQGKFDAAKSAFFANPTPENAQALQALVDPLLKSASEVFTRPSPEYRAIFDEVIGTLEQVKGAVDTQANDISDALAAALGTSNSLQDLTQKNTAAMAADMRQLLAIVTASAAAAGINLNAGTGILLPGTFPAGGQPVQPYQDTRQPGTGDQTAAGLTAAGVLGLLSGGAGLISPALALSEKLGLTDWLKETVSGLLGSSGVGTSSVLLPSGGSSITNPDILGAAYGGVSFPSSQPFTIPEFTIQMPEINIDFGALGSYSFSSLGSQDYNFSDIYAFQSGGHVPGQGRGDIVPAMLEPGEFVVPRHIAMTMRPFLENLIGGKKSIPTGPDGLHFATGGSVPLSSQDIQALILLQALLGTNNTQAMTQQQIAANTQLTAAILQQLAQRAGLSATGASSPTISMPTTPGLTLGSTTASPSAGLSLDALKASLQSQLAASPSTLLQVAQQLGVTGPRTGGTTGTGTGAIGAVRPPSGATSLGGSTGISGQVGGGGILDGNGGLVGALSAFSPILSLLSTASTIQGAVSGATPGDPGTLGSIFGIFSGGLGLLQGINNDDIFGSVAGGINTIANIYNLAASLSDGALPGLSEVIGSVVTELASTVGLDAALGSIPAAGVVQAIIAAIKIAQIASSDQSDEEKAIQATETAVLAAGAIAAPFTFGASLAVVQIIDFIERIRAGQDWDQALVQANDPTGIFNGFFGEDVSVSGKIFNPSSDWQNFGTELAQSFQQGAIGLNTLQAALPYVQTKAELGRLIETYKAYVAQTNDWTVGYQFGTTDLYKLGFFPEAGGSSHEGGLTVSFGTGINALQQIIDQLYAILPGDPITAGWGASYPNGGIGDSAEALRLWDRFVPGGGSIQAAQYVPETDLNALFQPYYQNFGQQAIPQSTLDAVLAVIDEAARRRALEQAQIALEAQLWYEQQMSSSPGGLASGGWVTGGVPGQDSVLKRLMPDEFVVPAAVARMNAGLLNGLVSDGTVRSEFGSTISGAATSGAYRGAGGVSQVTLNIHPGAFQIDGAKDPKATAREVLDLVEQGIRTGRLGQVVVTRVRQQR